MKIKRKTKVRLRAPIRLRAPTPRDLKRRRAKKYVPEYRVELAYDDFSRDTDRAVFKIAATVLGGRGYSDGSGFSFWDRKRDHTWHLADAVKAKRLARTLARIRDIPGLRVSIQAPPVQLVPR